MQFDDSAFYERFRRALGQRIIQFVRQSTLTQQRHNTGSMEVQRRQWRRLKAYGVDMERIEKIEAAESGRKGAQRPAFERLLKEVQGGDVGVVAVASHDRLGRNMTDYSRLCEAMRDNDTFLFAEGRPFDPTEADDDMQLFIMAKLAERENRYRTRRNTVMRLAKAHEGEYRIPLPTGLVWACPRDPHFRRRCDNSDSEVLRQWLDGIDDHRVHSKREGRAHYVLPYPDDEVISSLTLRFEWLLAERSLAGVIERIENHPDWPRPGRIPVQNGWVYSPDLTPHWRELRGDHSREREMLRKWFSNGAWYGRYEFTSKALKNSNQRKVA